MHTDPETLAAEVLVCLLGLSSPVRPVVRSNCTCSCVYGVVRFLIDRTVTVRG